MEIRKFKVLAFFLLAYLLFYDGVNTIASMASAFGESVLRINQSMNIMLLVDGQYRCCSNDIRIWKTRCCKRHKICIDGGTS